ncbi:4-hydroxythreonine-4-phosphate dehydrogenase PdxA [Pollutibacter soli]|uniref:4-hydroxythreonine-4-phosphate dehydrogenase PdxA n=1 Tax=Pollutibacter soli TaxID=3034157 RepID=UPI0030134B25
MINPQQRPVVGITTGDLNGIGIELIIKTFSDQRVMEFCTPVIFGSNKVINFYRKSLPEFNLNFNNIRELHKVNPKQLNIFSCWEEDVMIAPGTLTEAGGSYGIKSLVAAVQALKESKIQGLVTAPLHKKNVHSDQFPYTGHTPYLKNVFGASDVLMFMVAENMRVGVVTEHIPVAEVAGAITKEAILSKLKIMKESLRKDFGIDKPRIAVLGLNPHAGDEGLIGKEEETIIRPAVIEAKKNDLLVFGPYAADAFFARGSHEKFDGVLAMYHDQGLIPFKSLAKGEGVNYTAGLSGIRTSPDHGTAFDIAGKNKADESSFREALFVTLDIISKRMGYAEAHRNPLRKIAAQVVANVEDERIDLV